MHDFSDLNDDLEGMLALLALIDDYVGVSNTNMHLRAAAGRTARVLVPQPAEWRWMAGRASSPWFPGFSIYRQSLDGSWTQALARLREDLAAGAVRITRLPLRPLPSTRNPHWHDPPPLVNASPARRAATAGCRSG